MVAKAGYALASFASSLSLCSESFFKISPQTNRAHKPCVSVTKMQADGYPCFPSSTCSLFHKASSLLMRSSTQAELSAFSI